MQPRTFWGVVCIFIITVPAVLCSPAVPGQPVRPHYTNPNALPGDVSFVAEMQGEQLKAFMAAYNALQGVSDLAANKKHLENYSVLLVQNKDSYYVTFRPKSDPPAKQSGRPLVIVTGGENSMGREFRFTVRKTDYKVTKQVVLI